MGTLVSTGSITIADTNDGLSVFSASVYIVAASIPATPSGGSYNFTTKVVTPPSGWSSSIPTVTTTPVWISTFIFNTYDTSTPVTATTWSTPVKYSVAGNNGTNGSNGTNGADGARGASKFYTTGSSWSDATALAAVVARFPSGVVVNDEVTISNGTTFAMTKYWNGSAWVAPGQVIDGNLLVTGSVSAAKVNTNGLTIRDPSGNIILDASGGAALDWAKIGGSGKPANNATVGADGSNLNIASSGNMFPNSDFSSATHDWIVDYNQGGGTGYNFTRDLAYPDWAPAGGHNLGVVRTWNDSSSSGWFIVIYNKFIPVGSSQNIELSAYVSSHRCASRYLNYRFYDASFTMISQNWFDGNNNDNGGQDLASWTRVGGIITTPSNCKYIKVAFQVGALKAGETIDPYAWITKIFLGIPKAGQTQLSPWSASTSSGAFAELSQLTPANASTYIASAAIGTAQIANASITNALIANAAIGSANIQNAAIGSAQIANASIGDAHITNLSAGKITAGTLDANRIGVQTLVANKIVNNSLNKYSYAFGATGGTLVNGVFSSVIGLAKTFSHRDDGDVLILALNGSCDAGSVSNRQIGFSIEKSGGAVAYYWNSGAGNYVSLPTTRDVTASREIGLLSYYSTVNNNSQNVSSNIIRTLAYKPSFSDIYTYIGHIVVVSGTINIYFCVSQSSGSNKTSSEANLTVMDTYA